MAAPAVEVFFSLSFLLFEQLHLLVLLKHALCIFFLCEIVCIHQAEIPSTEGPSLDWYKRVVVY